MDHGMTATASARGLPLRALLLITTVFAFTLPSAYGEELIALGATWSYLDDGTDQGTAWRESDFDDSAWESGPAQLGFGEGDEATTITRGATTFYFRHDFSVASAGIMGLELTLRRDDGAIVYLNGTEIVRSNMPGGEVNYDTFAPNASDDGQGLHEYTVSIDSLVDGDNVLAVEVHQVNATSSDLSFDLSLDSTDVDPTANDIVSLGSTWSYLDDGTDQGSAWRESDFDDSGWASGPAQLGFGEGDEATTITRDATTFYFRHDFNVASAGIVGLDVTLRRDDGAIVYLNGTEIVRSNMPHGEVDYNTFAPIALDDGQNLHEYTVSVDALVDGDNVLAVEVHQANATSSDLSFDLSLARIFASTDVELERGPYLQLGTPSSMIVRWRTDGFTDTKLSYGPAPDSLDTTIEMTELTNEHEVSISGLDSNTKYYYEIGDSDSVLAGGDADHFFKTSPPAGSKEPVRIWVIGDSGQCAIDQDGCDEASAVMNEYLDWTAENGGRTADIVLMLGDNAYNNATDSETTRGLFEPFAEVLRNHVLWPVPGNHEFGASDSPTQSGPYYEAFTLPTAAEAGGIASGTEAYYSYDYGNVHFVALDSHDTNRDAPDNAETNICPGDGSGGAMYNWLCDDLAATTQDFIISYWHHPPYTKGSHDSDNRVDSEGRMHDMRERFVPMLEHYGADLNLSGHSHSYERSFLIDGHYNDSARYQQFRHAKDHSSGHPDDGGYTKDQGPNQGAIYSVVGSSSKNQGVLFNHPIMSYNENIEGSVVIDIEDTQMDAYFIRNDGAVKDEYRLTKNIDSGDLQVLMFPAAMDPTRQGFARVINHTASDGTVEIEAIDDNGVVFGPVSLQMDANETVHFNSTDLEDGNPDKGLPTGTRPGSGDWRLVLTSQLDIEVLSYIRTPADGFLTSMHDVVGLDDEGRHRVAIFNPGSNMDQVSQLRVINPGDAAVDVTITGIDDAGASPGDAFTVSIPANAATTLEADELESIESGDGLGDGTGKWQLFVESDQSIHVVNLMALPQTGHLTNLSTAPANVDAGEHTVPLFPAASDPLQRQGFVRVINHSAEAGEVSIEAFDDTDMEYPTSTLTLDANQTKHFNSDDLEMGNNAKGLSPGTGAGEGDWWLVLSSDLDIEVLAYIRTTHDGFLTAMHDTVRREGDRHRVPTFNPGSNTNQVSRLRLVNAGDAVVVATIWGIDDQGEQSSGTATVSVPAGTSRTLTAQELEAGGDGIDPLGDGAGKWQLVVESEQPLTVMSLLSSPTGHLTNLSTDRESVETGDDME